MSHFFCTGIESVSPTGKRVWGVSFPHGQAIVAQSKDGLVLNVKNFTGAWQISISRPADGVKIYECMVNSALLQTMPRLVWIEVERLGF